MANLFWKTKTDIKSLLATPFKTEEEFERTIFETSELLEDIFLLKRQVRGGGKTGIPDIIGIDSDGNVCIIEMKNVPVDANIIPQVLQYAFWAESNPDSVKSLWLESENKPDDLPIAWDNLQVRILVIAPSILRSTLDIVEKINYQVDLIEVTRWIEGDNVLLLVSKLEPEQKTKAKPVSGLPVYDEDFYMQHHNKQSVKEFMNYVSQVASLVKRKNWELDQKFNKHYCAFKAGFFIAFGIHWIGSKTFAIFIKLPEDEFAKFSIPMTKYEKEWNQAIYHVTPGKTKVEDFVSLFEKAYRHLTGK
ncbi:MAG: hypothetical protein HND45_02630 [Chloroflexi bacterium]|nr:hypothetical protein [Chloroflexota bacterium]NOG74773.1 hypothetical protein [Chloroflexota bacterium]HPP62990.1 hypothetical protein [Anaerolineales bacterium]